MFPLYPAEYMAPFIVARPHLCSSVLAHTARPQSSRPNSEGKESSAAATSSPSLGRAMAGADARAPTSEFFHSRRAGRRPPPDGIHLFHRARVGRGRGHKRVLTTAVW